MLSVSQALQKVLALADDSLGSEWVAIPQALGRVTAAPLDSRRDLPPFDNSAMDGYALRAADARPGARLRIIASLPAGSSERPSIGPGQAARIFTGAPLPPGADTIIMQEQVQREGEDLLLSGIKSPLAPGEHLRGRGADLRFNERLLEAGALIGPGEIAALTAAGYAGALMTRRPRIAVISTGHELRAVDEPLEFGQIVNSNAPMLVALCQSLGAEALAFATVRDDLEATAAAFETARGFDLILTSGGVSVGDHDLIQPALELCGWQKSFWKVALKPGKPLLCGRLPKGARVLALPGNPASALSTFELFARPLLRRLQRHPRPYLKSLPLPLAEAQPLSPGRALLLRGALDSKGAFSIQRDQGSGNLASLTQVNAYALLPSASEADPKRLPAGSLVTVFDRLHDGAADWPDSIS